jgi:hypothetical protein
MPSISAMRRLRSNSTQESSNMSKEICAAGQEAIEELGLTHEESQLQNLALYIFLLEQENSALKQNKELLSPTPARDAAMA